MKIAILGYGKMGREIEKLALEEKCQIVSIIDKKKLFGDIKDSEVAINFSTPNSALENIFLALNNDVPVVCGTTGWLNDFDKVVKHTKEKNTAFLYSSNFSFGVNLFFKINHELAKLIKEQTDYNISIKETHHIEKIDAPSGTAISLAEDIINNTKYENWSLTSRNEKNILSVKSERKEKVHGIHQVNYSSILDDISIRHESFSRKSFAKGALLAALWLKGKKGVFGMNDVLNF